MRRRLTRILFALSGFVPPLGLTASPPEVTLLIYSWFVVVCLRRPRLLSATTPAHPLHFWILLMATGCVTEILAWSNAYLRCDPQPGVLHPQLLADVLLGLGFYSSWAVAWIFIRRKYAFTLRQAVVTQGVYGVLVEKQGGIFLSGLSTLPVGLVLWLFVFVVYGSTLGIPFALARYDANVSDKPAPRRRYILVAALMALSLLVVFGGWSVLLSATGLLPPQGPICTRPLW